MAIDNPFNPEICFDTPVGRICFPILSSPTFPSPPAGGTKSDSSHMARCIAMGAAEIHGSVFRELRRLFEEAGGDRKTFARGVLDQFRKSGQISQVDERDLLEIVEIVFSRDRKDVHTHLRRIYERVIDRESAPLTIALAGIASDSANFAAESGEAEGPILFGDFMGAIAGAAAGSAAGGVGAVPGAVVVGGTASFLAWW